MRRLNTAARCAGAWSLTCDSDRAGKLGAGSEFGTSPKMTSPLHVTEEAVGGGGVQPHAASTPGTGSRGGIG